MSAGSRSQARGWPGSLLRAGCGAQAAFVPWTHGPRRPTRRRVWTFAVCDDRGGLSVAYVFAEDRLGSTPKTLLEGTTGVLHAAGLWLQGRRRGLVATAGWRASPKPPSFLDGPR
jgi:hypothetical protein